MLISSIKKLVPTCATVHYYYAYIITFEGINLFTNIQTTDVPQKRYVCLYII